jgi:hypothetical protein
MNMQYLSSQVNIPYGVNTDNNNQPMMTFLNRRRKLQFPSPEQQSNIRIQSQSIVPSQGEPVRPTMIWGPPIWFLFHTLAEKVKEDLFLNIKTDLLNNIYSIATHLPCPICSTHATEYFNRINFNSIQTKTDLKLMLFQFHNDVNKRKGYSIFSVDELNDKYKNAVTVKIIQNFMIHFKDRNRSPKLIADDLQRTRIAAYLTGWFQQNIQFFDL